MTRDQDETAPLGPGWEPSDPGRTVSHYRIVGKLGEGGMGVVYKAEDTKLERTVALKFLPAEVTRDPDAKERFLREARAASALDHPNICTVHEFDEVEGHVFIAMAFVDGQSLRDRIKSGSLQLDDVLDIGIQTATGLCEAHEKGIVHRDIKPANIMVSSGGQVKILDFGLATSPIYAQLTKAGTTLGTVSYMSPEQARGEPVDHRADVWALGVTLYEMIAGRLPFPGDRDQTVIHAIIHEEPKPLDDDVDPGLARIVARALSKEPSGRYPDARELLDDLTKLRDLRRGVGAPGGSLRSLFRPKVALPVALVAVAAIALVFWQLRARSRIQWAKTEAIPEIERLADEAWGEETAGPILAAFAIAEEVEQVIPDDPELGELWSRISSKITITTEPPGARVYVKEYSTLDGDWDLLGETPIEEIRLPLMWSRWRFEKDGYETAYAVSSTFPDSLTRTLDPSGSIPDGMIRVEAEVLDEETFPSFFIDRYEVTNREYKEFVDAGGYRSREYWKGPFEKDGKVLSWDEAMAEFVDATARPGPSTWNGGDYPDGHDDYPVSGVSWYEAAAYAEFVGKELPTTPQWGMAAGEERAFRSFSQRLIPISNLQTNEVAPVGTFQGMTASGAYDMAGNVREWCWEAAPGGRTTRGGAWDDVYYMFGNVSQQPPFSRSPKNGIRLVINPDREKIPTWAWEPYEEPQRDYRAMTPVSDEVFEIYRSRFAYDRGDLAAVVEETDDSAEDWIHEKISFNAAYGNERMVIHLLLPRRGIPPFQTVILFPHSGAVGPPTLQLERDERFFDFFLKNGRAFVIPILRGTYERNLDDFDLAKHLPTKEHQHTYTEYMIRWGKDYGRTIDYLETRPDIDHEKLAFYGLSWGARIAPVITAVESRFSASIVVLGGFWSVAFPLPDADEFNYAPRVRVPTLMLNGKYDMVFGLESEVRPMFDLLGVPDDDKRLATYETDHRIPHNALISESLDWLDRYLGPVE